jgi:AcrR family transcriptional regulator
MAQHLKDEVERAIARAALRVFSLGGYRSTSMATIAREAGISTGNLYRYFASKEALFLHVVPEALGKQLLKLLRARISNASTLPSSTPSGAEALLEFALEHRLELIILLGRGEGTPHEGFAKKVRARLEEWAVMRFRELYPRRAVPSDRGFQFALQQAYLHFVESMVSALVDHEDPSLIRICVDGYSRYHLAGLMALFATEATHD